MQRLEYAPLNELHFVPFVTHYSVIIMFPYSSNKKNMPEKFNYINTEKNTCKQSY